MTTYRIVTNGTRFRVEMQDSGDKYQSWTPCQDFATEDEARAYRDRAARPRERWTPTQDLPVEVP
jgi:hypothetical protein